MEHKYTLAGFALFGAALALLILAGETPAEVIEEVKPMTGKKDKPEHAYLTDAHITEGFVSEGELRGTKPTNPYSDLATAMMAPGSGLTDEELLAMVEGGDDFTEDLGVMGYKIVTSVDDKMKTSSYILYLDAEVVTDESGRLEPEMNLLALTLHDRTPDAKKIVAANDRTQKAVIVYVEEESPYTTDMPEDRPREAPKPKTAYDELAESEARFPASKKP